MENDWKRAGIAFSLDATNELKTFKTQLAAAEYSLKRHVAKLGGVLIESENIRLTIEFKESIIKVKLAALYKKDTFTSEAERLLLAEKVSTSSEITKIVEGEIYEIN